eukprot:TRINITY_DN60350_c0_g1_i1.p1 TRINITY_DN60350_c0_g1~~TRINITY_DN60350_c0_g1_i1.p1  ORF type:complete len:642 (+),score=85.98 TRINITY_DN60350_c0_g1_i1:37-1962(+)
MGNEQGKPDDESESSFFPHSPVEKKADTKDDVAKLNSIPNFDSFALSFNKSFPSFDATADPITPEEFYANRFIEELKKDPLSVDLTGCGMGDEGVIGVASAATKHEGARQLRYLNLDDNKLCDTGVAVVARMLDKLAKVKSQEKGLARFLKTTKQLTLSLKNNRVGDVGAKALAQALKGSSISINLQLSNNCISQEGAAALCAAFVGLPNSVFHLGHNAIGVIGATHYAQTAADNKAFTEVLLPNCDLGNDGVIAISQTLRGLRQISSVDVSRNRVGPSGLQELCGCFSHPKGKIISLTLNNNPIKIEGVQAVAALIKATSSLDYLGLSGCEVDDIAADILATAMKRNNTVSSLVLSKNKLTDTAASAFAHCLVYNRRILHLDFRNNNITDKGAHDMAFTMKNQRTLKTLNLSGNPITDAGVKAILGALKSNQHNKEFELLFDAEAPGSPTSTNTPMQSFDKENLSGIHTTHYRPKSSFSDTPKSPTSTTSQPSPAAAQPKPVAPEPTKTEASSEKQEKPPASPPPQSDDQHAAEQKSEPTTESEDQQTPEQKSEPTTEKDTTGTEPTTEQAQVQNTEEKTEEPSGDNAAAKANGDAEEAKNDKVEEEKEAANEDVEADKKSDDPNKEAPADAKPGDAEAE